MYSDFSKKIFLGGTLIDGTGSPALRDSAVLIEGETIKALGRRVEVEVPEDCEIHDISGMTITPGLIDAHVHFLSIGLSILKNIDLSDTRSLEEALEKVKEKVQESEPGEWVIGKGWDESNWPEDRYITKEDLDGWSPDNPVMLVRVCGHLISLNSKALEEAGIMEDTNDPEGGKIDRDEAGQATGVLRDCRDLVQKHIPRPTDEDLVNSLELSSDLALRLGCTSIHDAGIGADRIRAYQTALDEGKLKVRANLMMRYGASKAAVNLGVKSGFGNEMIRLGPIKLLMDGSIGARTAAMFEPYDDDPSTTGLLLMELEELKDRVEEAHKKGLQVSIHAIGDLAIEHVINAIMESLRSNPRRDHRHRVEHCEIMTSQQIEMMNQLNIIASMQPNFVGRWGGPDSMYEARLGANRDRSGNPYRALLDEGVKLCFGSDGMPFNPIYGIHSAVNHPHKHNAITLEEAIKCYTLNSAYASFEEDVKGSIEPGKLADLTIFDRDLTDIPKEEICEAQVEMTLVGGDFLFRREEASTKE
ncbi:MAG: amidohydrolase [Candidatus Bathyarchaeia archaeon]